jgi:hypothetical protein
MLCKSRLPRREPTLGRRVVLGLALAPLLYSDSLLAEYVDYHVCAAGLNMGQAASREFFFGRAHAPGEPPADHAGLVGDSLKQAKEHILAAESLFIGPQTEFRGAAVQRLIGDIDRYSSDRWALTFGQRANRISGVAGNYRDSVAWTFASQRPDDFQAKLNCTAHLFNACYQFGYGTTAVLVKDTDPSALGGTLTGMRTSIHQGLQVAIDGYPPEPSIPKICCFFGPSELWAPFLAMDMSSTHGDFSARQPELLAAARSVQRHGASCSPPSPTQHDWSGIWVGRSSGNGYYLTRQPDGEIWVAIRYFGPSGASRGYGFVENEVAFRLVPQADGSYRGFSKWKAVPGQWDDHWRGPGMAVVAGDSIAFNAEGSEEIVRARN